LKTSGERRESPRAAWKNLLSSTWGNRWSVGVRPAFLTNRGPNRADVSRVVLRGLRVRVIRNPKYGFKRKRFGFVGGAIELRSDHEPRVKKVHVASEPGGASNEACFQNGVFLDECPPPRSIDGMGENYIWRREKAEFEGWLAVIWRVRSPVEKGSVPPRTRSCCRCQVRSRKTQNGKYQADGL